jgi:hypothetical protein
VDAAIQKNVVVFLAIIDEGVSITAISLLPPKEITTIILTFLKQKFFSLRARGGCKMSAEDALLP